MVVSRGESHFASKEWIASALYQVLPYNRNENIEIFIFFGLPYSKGKN